MKLTDNQKKLLKDLVEHYEKEDRTVRERQIKTWRRLKLLWDGFSQTWYSEVAHDWRIWEQEESDDSQSYYDKPVNVFRAFLESIIAALSVTVPPIKCYPEDADNPLDLLTAKAGDKVGKLIYRHNDVSLLWLHALYVYCTEGMIACYTYPKESKEYGVYEKEKTKEEVELHKFTTCPNCAEDINEESILPEEVLIPQIDELTGEPIIDEINQMPEICPNCGAEGIMENRTEEVTVNKVIGTEILPKTRQCMDVYGGLYVKVANYAKKQADTPYLIFSYETDYTLARDRYPDIRDKITPGSNGGVEPYEQWARTNLQYQGDYPVDNVTIRNNWFRSSTFEMFEEKECKELKEKFPNGVKIVMVNDEFAEAIDENLDDHWTLSYNPLSDSLYHDPIGMLLISVQELTNDIISLTQQTIEHGIPQTFADSAVLNREAYSKMETTPGAIYFATPKSGKSMSDAFHEVKTATLSGEILPFFQKIQELGQLTSGAQPSLFGGQMAGSKTASEYSMSRAQSLQRLQNHWKIITIWWKTSFSKAIPGYIKCVSEDEKFVEQDSSGNFVNIFIRKAELEGKIGRIELEANENLPITWAQRKDVIMELLNGQNPQLTQMLSQPQNLPLIYEALGLDDLYIPGEDDRNKQYEEIKELLNSEPMLVPPSPEDEMMAMETTGMPAQEIEESSIEIDPIIDNHALEFEVCRGWLISDAGRLAKVENPNGYKNIMLHALAHQQIMQQQQMEMMAQEQAQTEGAGKKPKEDMKAPIKGEERVTS